jgi:hypothetical protein
MARVVVAYKNRIAMAPNLATGAINHLLLAENPTKGPIVPEVQGGSGQERGGDIIPELLQPEPGVPKYSGIGPGAYSPSTLDATLGSMAPP